MAHTPVPLLRKAFGEQITDHLRDSLVNGEFRPGQRLTEEELAAKFGVSRGPVRDALRQLANERLVSSGRSGTYVIGISEDDIAELYLLRQAIETLAASLAMDRVPADGWGEMLHAVVDLERTADAHDEHGFAEADVRFHSLIYQYSGHRRLGDVWNQYSPILTRLLKQTILVRDDLVPTAARHRLLLDLLRGDDHAAVEAELRDHLEDSHQRMVLAFRRRTGGADPATDYRSSAGAS
jgi:GntR family transcriptional regulator of gluconate operon